MHNCLHKSTTEDTITNPKTAWRKVLYLKQPYPDNHTDESFLAQMRLNTQKQNYNYIEILLASGSVCRHISSISLFVCVFVYLQEAKLGAEDLLAIVVLLAAGLHIVLLAILWRKAGVCMKSCVTTCAHTHTRTHNLDAHTTKDMDIHIRDDVVQKVCRKSDSDSGSRWEWLETAKTFILLLLLLLGMSPVLTTLTESVSTDSIYTMAGCMFVLNVANHDYRTHPTLKATNTASVTATLVPATTPVPATTVPITRALLPTDLESTPTCQPLPKHGMLHSLLPGHAHSSSTEGVVSSLHLSLRGINEAMFASVCLASRLNSALDGFALLAFAVEIFVLLPFTMKTIFIKVADSGDTAMFSSTMTVAFVTSTVCLLIPLVTQTVAIAYLCVIGTITFVAPALLISAQRYKRQIEGPWDEAVVNNLGEL